MKPSSFCSIATFGRHDELFGLLLTLSIHHRNCRVYCAVDTITKEFIEEYSPKLDLEIYWAVSLDEYSGLDRDSMEKNGVWNDFLMQKAMIIDEALKHEEDTLFLDSDILLLDTIDNIDNSQEIGVSPHYIKDSDVSLYGYYNGGVMWTNQKSLKDDWVEFTKSSRYCDQAAIEDLVKKYDTFEFEENYNFSWWRMTQSNVPPQKIVSNLSIQDNRIHYKNKPLKFIHTHFYEQDLKAPSELSRTIAGFNDLMIQGLNAIKDYRTLLIINRMINGEWIIKLPKQPMDYPWNHSNDSFRELLRLLEDKNSDLKIEENSESGHLWLGDNILLYDRPTTLWFNREVLQSYKMLLGNGDVEEETSHLRQNKLDVSPWIFWPRKPKVLEEILQADKILNYSSRDIESIFIGNYENDTQKQFRNTDVDWKSFITEFHCTSGDKHKFTQEEYLNKLRNSKYGLCLRGFGSKCHREVELMAFGTVPLITPEVSIESYMDAPIENVHYIKISDPDDARKKISDITEDEWTQMSKACYDWYQKNVHSDNCWNNTLNSLFYDS